MQTAIDSIIAPTRPSMPKVSREIHNSVRYNACVIRAGLIVQSHRTGTGKLLPVNHPQYTDYVSAIETAIDTSEADALCRALL